MTSSLFRLNFRDVGGLSAVNGGRLRSGLLYRSEGPGNFGPEHRRELEALYIRAICDLRSPEERETAPHDWCGKEMIFLHVDMRTDLRVQGNDGWIALRADPTKHGARTAMRLNYEAMPAALLPDFRQLAEMLISAATVLLHCTAGKDRTGVAVALLLSALGVSPADIMDDYLRSAVFGINAGLTPSTAHQFEKNFGVIPTQEIIDALIGVHPAYLNAALARVDAQWGSIKGFFRAAGLDEALQARLCSAFVIPPAPLHEAPAK